MITRASAQEAEDQRPTFHFFARRFAISGRPDLALELCFRAGPPTVLTQAQEFVEDTEAYAAYAAILHAIAQGDAFRGGDIKLF